MSSGAKPERLPTKRETVEILFARGENVFLHLNPKHPCVIVPPHLKDRLPLVLEIGLNMPLPIKGLVVDDRGISGTLSFDREPYFCNVPWEAVHAIIGSRGQGGVWTTRESVPPKPKPGLRRIK